MSLPSSPLLQSWLAWRQHRSDPRADETVGTTLGQRAFALRSRRQFRRCQEFAGPNASLPQHARTPSGRRLVVESAKMNVLATFPSFRSVALDTSDARGLAEFYRDLLGFRYRDGDERPPVGQPDPVGNDFVMLVDPSTGMRLAFQQVEGLQQSTWPLADVPQQLHLDLSVSDAVELATQRDRALSLGATLLDDRSDDPRELLYVFADPAGHPFCVFVVSPS